MYQYTWIQWLFFFLFYCFLGWCFESGYVSLKKKQFVNRGFIRGPFLPIYGSGALMMLIVSRPFHENIMLTFLAGCVGATVLEYVTGAVMEAVFKVRYWDYSNQKFQFQGHICLSSTLAWGVLTILVTRIVHRLVENLAFCIPEWFLTLITMTVYIIFVADFSLSFRAALDLRDVLTKMEQAKREMERMQKRLDVIIAVTDEAIENLRNDAKEELEDYREEFFMRKEELLWRWDDLEANIESKLAKIENRIELLRDKMSISEKLQDRKAELSEHKKEFQDLYKCYFIRKEHQEIQHFLESVLRRNMILGNPDMKSDKFEESLEELKKFVNNYRNKKA